MKWKIYHISSIRRRPRIVAASFTYLSFIVSILELSPHMPHPFKRCPCACCEQCYCKCDRAMSANRKRSYDAAFKLAAVEDAEKTANRAAARKFRVDEHRIREWRQKKSDLARKSDWKEEEKQLYPRRKQRAISRIRHWYWTWNKFFIIQFLSPPSSSRHPQIIAASFSGRKKLLAMAFDWGNTVLMNFFGREIADYQEKGKYI